MSEPLSTDRTFFSAGTHIEGTLELDGEVKLEGHIKGKVTGTGVVTSASMRICKPTSSRRSSSFMESFAARCMRPSDSSCIAPRR